MDISYSITFVLKRLSKKQISKEMATYSSRQEGGDDSSSFDDETYDERYVMPSASPPSVASLRTLSPTSTRAERRVGDSMRIQSLFVPNDHSSLQRGAVLTANERQSSMLDLAVLVLANETTAHSTTISDLARVGVRPLQSLSPELSPVPREATSIGDVCIHRQNITSRDLALLNRQRLTMHAEDLDAAYQPAIAMPLAAASPFPFSFAFAHLQQQNSMQHSPFVDYIHRREIERPNIAISQFLNRRNAQESIRSLSTTHNIGRLTAHIPYLTSRLAPPTSLNTLSQLLGPCVSLPNNQQALQAETGTAAGLDSHIQQILLDEPTILNHRPAAVSATAEYTAGPPISACLRPSSIAPSSLIVAASRSPGSLTAGHLAQSYAYDTSSVHCSLETTSMVLIGGKETFPMVLHRLLAHLELVEGGTRIAAFLPDGEAFQVRNHYLLENEVLPSFFPKMKGYASFQRQLNLYDFKRIGGAGIDRGAYRHESFIREYPAKSSEMKRRRLKGGPPRGRSSAIVSNGNDTEEM